MEQDLREPRIESPCNARGADVVSVTDSARTCVTGETLTVAVFSSYGDWYVCFCMMCVFSNVLVYFLNILFLLYSLVETLTYRSVDQL